MSETVTNPAVPLPQNSGSSLSGGVPGMVIEGLNTGSQRPQLRGSAAVESRPPAAAVPAKPQIIARATPAPEPQQRAPVPRKPIPREETAVAAPRAPAKPVQPAAGSGFVSVLTSQKSRMDALKAFADMQQKYTDVLQNRTPDVRFDVQMILSRWRSITFTSRSLAARQAQALWRRLPIARLRGCTTSASNAATTSPPNAVSSIPR